MNLCERIARNANKNIYRQRMRIFLRMDCGKGWRRAEMSWPLIMPTLMAFLETATRVIAPET